MHWKQHDTPCERSLMSKLIFKHLPRMFGRCKGTFRNIIIFQNQTFFKYFRQRYISLAPPTERSYGVVVVGNVYKLRKLLDIYFVKHVTMSHEHRGSSMVDVVDRIF